MIHSDTKLVHTVVVAWISMAEGISGTRWTHFMLLAQTKGYTCI